jgi:hypothetical protein
MSWCDDLIAPRDEFIIDIPESKHALNHSKYSIGHLPMDNDCYIFFREKHLLLNFKSITSSW